VIDGALDDSRLTSDESYAIQSDHQPISHLLNQSINQSTRNVGQCPR